MMTRKKLQGVIDAVNAQRQWAGIETDIDVRDTGSGQTSNRWWVVEKARNPEDRGYSYIGGKSDATTLHGCLLFLQGQREALLAMNGAKRRF